LYCLHSGLQNVAFDLALPVSALLIKQKRSRQLCCHLLAFTLGRGPEGSPKEESCL